MEWIKKNWIWIAVALLVIAVIVGIIRYRKKEKELVIKIPKLPGMAGRGAAPAGESPEQAKAKLDACMAGTANIRLATGAPHPCAALKDAYEKAKSESSFVGPFTETEGLNLQAFAMGADGTALLQDKQV